MEAIVQLYFFIITVPVKSVDLDTTSIEVIAGELMNLTCTSSYCNPQSTISWFMLSTDITNFSTTVTDEKDGLLRTKSSLQKIVYKIDNRRKVQCKASNIPDQLGIATEQTVTVWCK